MVFENSLKEIDHMIKDLEATLPNAQKKKNKPSGKNNGKKQKGGKNKGGKKAVVYSKNDAIANFQKTNIVIGEIVSAEKHPNADTLCLLKLNAGEPQERTVVAGVFKYYSPEELLKRRVCLILNLKPSKLKGISSEAMLLAGSCEIDGKMSVKLVEPPASGAIGERVFVDDVGSQSKEVPEAAERCSPKVWKKCVALLAAQGGKATYNNLVMKTKSGECTVPLPDGSEIH